ncbi:MAG: hypothetical protein R6V01_02515, partial [Thermoplasmatota archaeon]
TSNSVTYFNNTPFEVDASGSYDQNGIKLYKFNSTDPSQNLWSNRSVWNVTFRSTGNHTVWVEVMDPSGRTNSSYPLNITIIERPTQPNDEVYPDPPILFDPDPSPPDQWNDLDEKMDIFWKITLLVFLLLIIVLFLMFILRNRNIKEVEWEDENAWMDEDWLDVDLDEEPDIEEDMIFFE